MLWYVSYFVLKTQELEKNLENFIHTGSEILMLDPNLSPTAYTSGLFINARYNLFTPPLKPMTTVDLRKYSFRIRIYWYRVWNINAGSEILSQTMIPRILIRTRSFWLLNPYSKDTTVVYLIFNFYTGSYFIHTRSRIINCCHLFQRFRILPLG